MLPLQICYAPFTDLVEKFSHLVVLPNSPSEFVADALDCPHCDRSVLCCQHVRPPVTNVNGAIGNVSRRLFVLLLVRNAAIRWTVENYFKPQRLLRAEETSGSDCGLTGVESRNED